MNRNKHIFIGTFEVGYVCNIVLSETRLRMTRKREYATACRTL